MSAAECRKFSPNIFNRTKCQNCFRTKDAHSAEALESNRATRKASKCGYLFVAPDWDFSVSLNRTKRWQRRWFVLYDDGELTYSVDEHPDTIPQAIIDMNKVIEVVEAEDITGNQYSLALRAPEKVHFIKGTSKEESRWWFDVLSCFPRNTFRGRLKRNTFPSIKSTNITEKSSRGGAEKERFLSDKEWHEMESNNIKSEKNIVELENANNKLHNNLNTALTIITIKDKDNINEEVPIKEKTKGVLEGSAELIKGIGRRYLKKENRVLKSQRSRSDGVAKMIPSTFHPRDLCEDWSQKTCHQNPVYVLLSDVVNSPCPPYQIDKGQEIIKKNIINKEKSENSLQDSQIRGDPDGCNLDFTCGNKFEEECIKKGWLTRQGVNREWFKHWFVLKNRSLSYFRDPSTEGSGILDGVLDIGQTKSVEEMEIDQHFAFVINMFDNKKFTLSSITPSIRKSWVQAILKEAGLDQDISKSQSISEISLLNEESNDSMLNKEETYLALPPSPLLNRTAISRVKEKARSRSSSRSRNSHRLHNSSFLAADSDDSEPISPRLKECIISIDTVDNTKQVDIVKNNMVSPRACLQQDKTNEVDALKVIKDYKELEEKYLLLKKKIDSNEKRFENGDYKLLKTKYDTLKLKYKKEKADPEFKNNKDVDTEKGKRDSDRKSKKDLEITKLKTIITDLQTQCSNQQQIIKENLSELDQLRSLMEQKPKGMNESNNSQGTRGSSLTSQDPISSDTYQQVDSKEAHELKLLKAKEHILLLKKELLESHKNYDELEMRSFTLKQQMIKMEENHENQMKLMSSRVDDLTLKLSTSEKTLRQVKQKLQKLESRQERRRSSLKGKESMNLSKDYESKLTELEQKIMNMDFLNKSNEETETSDSLKAGPKKRTDSAESSNMIMRLYNLDTMVKSILDESLDQEKPRIRLQVKNIEENSPDEDWSSLSLTTSMPDLYSVEGEDEVANSLQECFEFVEQKLDAALLWLKNNFLTLAQKGSCKEIENIKLLLEYLTRGQVYKNKNRMDVILYNMKLLKEISRCLYRHIKPVNIETIFDVAVEKLNNILSTILNDGNTCIWTNHDIKKEVIELFISVLPPLVSVFSFKLNKTQINLLESKIKEIKTNYKYISDTWVNQSSTDAEVINITTLLASIQSNISKVFLNSLDKHAFLIDQPALQSWKEQFQYNYEKELISLHSQILDDPKDLVLKVSSQAYLLAAICVIETLLRSSLSEADCFKPELCPLQHNLNDTTLLCLFILDCPIIAESLSISSNYLDLMQLSFTRVACNKCPEIQQHLDSLQASHKQQRDMLQKETEEMQSSLSQKEEHFTNQVQCLHDQLEASQKQNKVLLEEHEAQLKSLQEVYSQKLSQNTEIFMDESIRRRYQKEIEQLKALCDKGLTAMETSHKHLIEDLKMKHHQEIEDLKDEKDKLLAEETQATVTALEVIKRAHQQELEQELIKFQQELTRRIKTEPKQQYYISELAEVKKEIVELLDKYSIQCLEKVTLEERLKISSRQLQESNLQILELTSRNKLLRAHLSTDINKKLENLPQNSDVSLKHLLEIREQEIAKQQDEITHLKNDLILAQTHVDTLNIHCQELEENRLALREDQLCNLASRLEALVQAASNLDYSNQEVKDNDRPVAENIAASGSLKNSHPPYWLKSYSCSREMSKAPSYPGLGTYTGSSAWRATPKSTN